MTQETALLAALPSLRDLAPAADDLEDVRHRVGDETRSEIARIVQDGAAELSEIFYSAMFADVQSAPLLDHDVVNKRLHASMQRWLEQLFDPAASFDALMGTQRRAGEMHARVGVPLPLVSRAARHLKRAVLSRMEATALMQRADILHAAQYVEELFAFAIDAMAGAFASNESRLARSDEAYRLYFLGQDLKAERALRRSDLLGWVRVALERYYWRADTAPADTAPRSSPFALWLHHKATMMFDGSPELAAIGQELAYLEDQLLPALRRARTRHTRAREIVAEFHRRVDLVEQHLERLFDRYQSVHPGRDAVTDLLSRRYFPAVVRREIDTARVQSIGFTVLMLDIDRFADMLQGGGVSSGDALLAQMAAMLQERLRAGDFVFRVGDDEFLVLLVENAAGDAQAVAEGLRQSVEAHPFRLANGEACGLTVSVGIAAFDGHPDYQRLLERADAALRRAKAEGGNRCALG